VRQHVSRKRVCWLQCKSGRSRCGKQMRLLQRQQRRAVLQLHCGCAHSTCNGSSSMHPRSCSACYTQQRMQMRVRR
jgi:hypothetical protein